MRKIVSYLRGNLGNQLFVYATARAIQEKFGGNIYMDEIKNVTSNQIKDYRLVENLKFTRTENRNIVQRFLMYYVYKKKLKTPRVGYNHAIKYSRLYQMFGLYLLEDGYMPLPKKMNNSIVADGFFQSSHYFDEIKDKLIEELTPINPILDENIGIAKLIENTESVCISLRLGDFVSNPLHNVCTVKYFQSAVEEMKKLKPNCVFYLFSDEIDKAKKMLNLPENTVFEEGSNPPYEKLRIMAKCKHFILSNSSFSWWVQYLSENEEKIVIAPNKWYNEDIPCDIYEDDWIILEC